MRTATSEHEALRLRFVHLGIGDDEAIKSLVTCLLLPSAETECAIRYSEVFVPRLGYTSCQASTPPSPLIRAGGSILITGATGGIGSRIARWLVDAHGIRDLVLMSRRGENAPGAKALIAELAERGVEATVVAADVSELESLSSVLSLFGNDRPLRGVIHTAAVLDDGVLSSLTAGRCDNVMKSKVDGAWNLHLLTKDLDLDLFLLFSSVSGILGTAGQANYAAANPSVDALAHWRRANDMPAFSVAWGPWSGEGMVAKLDEGLKRRMSQQGVNLLGTEDGLALLQEAISRNRPLSVAVSFDFSKIGKYFGSQAHVPRLFRSLLPDRSLSISSRDTNQQKPALGIEDLGLFSTLKKSAPSEHRGIILAEVRAVVGVALGFASAEEVAADQPLSSVGIDSLMAIRIRNQLARMTTLNLSPRISLNHPNLEALSYFLLTEMVAAGLLTSASLADHNTLPLSGIVTASASSIGAKGTLDPSLTFSNAVSSTNVVCPQTAFVTGATGFVGAYLVSETLRRGVITYALVRATSTESARKRVVDQLVNYNLWKPQYARLLKSVVGDMSQPLLGLPEQTFDKLADHVDLICHAGALVDWMRPLDHYVGPNVASVHEVLRLAAQGRGKAIHYVSTVATLPRHAGYEVASDETEYGYATSKYMAETMIAAARWRGAQASVYRLPFVTASSSTGQYRRNRGDFLHNLITGSTDMGAFPFVDASLSGVLPVDYLTQTMAIVMIEDPDRINHDYDFMDSKAPDFNDFVAMICRAVCNEVEVLQIPFLQWREQALRYASQNAERPLARIAALVDGLRDEKDMASMLGGVDTYPGANVFGGEVFPAPEMNQAFVERYVACVKTNDGLW